MQSTVLPNLDLRRPMRSYPYTLLCPIYLGSGSHGVNRRLIDWLSCFSHTCPSFLRAPLKPRRMMAMVDSVSHSCFHSVSSAVSPSYSNLPEGYLSRFGEEHRQARTSPSCSHSRASQCCASSRYPHCVLLSLWAVSCLFAAYPADSPLARPQRFSLAMFEPSPCTSPGRRLQDGRKTMVSPPSILPSSLLMCISGDVIYLSFINKPIIVLNSAEAARDLLQKRGAIYSDRPVSTLYKMCACLSYSVSIRAIAYALLGLDGARSTPS